MLAANPEMRLLKYSAAMMTAISNLKALSSGPMLGFIVSSLVNTNTKVGQLNPGDSYICYIRQSFKKYFRKENIEILQV